MVYLFKKSLIRVPELSVIVVGLLLMSEVTVHVLCSEIMRNY